MSDTTVAIVAGAGLIAVGTARLVGRDRVRDFDRRLGVLPPRLASSRRYGTWVYVGGPAFLITLGLVSLVAGIVSAVG